MLRTLLKHPEAGKLVVPIVPDEGRTFGLESAIRQVGIYASQGQLYTPHDQDVLLYYRDYAMVGDITLGEKKYSAMLVENKATGDFSAASWLLIDRNGAGKFDARSENEFANLLHLI